MEPTKTYPNGDLYYKASKGKILLQKDTGRRYYEAFEASDSKHHIYEEVDDE